MTIWEIREERNLTQRDLAALLGVTEKTVWRWEAGITKPHPNQRKAVAARLGVPLRELTFDAEA